MMFCRNELIRQLVVSAALEDMERLRFLIEHRQIPVDSTFNGKPSALCYAAMRGNNVMTDYLLCHGADVNFTDQLGQTPLMFAVLGHQVSIVNHLLSHGADPARKNNVGQTALALARKMERHCCVALLTDTEARTRLLH